MPPFHVHSWSCAAYVLDLQAAFCDRRPAAETIFSSAPAMVQANSHYPSSSPGGDSEDDRLTWRAYALNLESEAARLKGQLEAERVSKYLNSRLPLLFVPSAPLSSFGIPLASFGLWPLHFFATTRFGRRFLVRFGALCPFHVFATDYEQSRPRI